MKSPLLPILALCALSLPLFGGVPAPDQLTAIRTMISAPLPDVAGTPTLSSGIVANNNTTVLYFNSSTLPVYKDTVTGVSVSFVTSLTGQVLTLPTIKNGLLASGSVANDLSASTGAFLTSTGIVTLGGGTNAVILNGPVVNKSANYVASGAATVTLTAAQSGQTFLFDSAAGIVYTLPAPVVGLSYSFQATVTVTSNAHEVRTNTGTVFIEGTIAEFGTTIGGFLANGSTHQAIKMTGTTLGGLIGTQFTLTCVSATEWMIAGVVMASGTVATPFNATP